MLLAPGTLALTMLQRHGPAPPLVRRPTPPLVRGTPLASLPPLPLWIPVSPSAAHPADPPALLPPLSPPLPASSGRSRPWRRSEGRRRSRDRSRPPYRQHGANTWDHRWDPDAWNDSRGRDTRDGGCHPAAPCRSPHTKGRGARRPAALRPPSPVPPAAAVAAFLPCRGEEISGAGPRPQLKVLILAARDEDVADGVPLQRPHL